MPRTMAVVVFALGAAMAVQAQGPGGRGGPGGPGFGPGYGLGPRMGFAELRGVGWPGGPVVTNQPYSDTESSTETIKRKDGKTVTHELREQKWRDAAGRTRTEFTLPAAGQRPAVHRAEIFDPVAGTLTTLDFTSKVAEVRQLPPRRPHRQRPEGKDGQQRPAPPGVTVTETDLPGKQIVGIYATGKEVTRTVAAGTHGNPDAIVLTLQRYVSPDLKIVLYSSENGPRGSLLHQVTALTRSDPDEALFSVPGDFTVRNAPPHGFRRFRGPHGQGGPGGGDGPAPPAGE